MSEPGKRPELPRVMGLRDVVLFNITAIVGLRWLTTAASQFGLASLSVWVVAMLVFFIPSAIAVRELADIDPSSGGIYCWVDRAYGPRQAFVAGWLYWVNNLLYFPSLLVATAAIAAYAGGPRTASLGNDPGFIRIVSLVGLWIAVWLNVVGLRVGKWLQNLGGIGTWIPALLFVLLAVWGFAARGSATPIHVSGLVPTRFDFPSINLFATMTFAFAGLELAPTLGGEIHNAAATLRRGVVVSGFAIVAVYIIGTAAMIVALPANTVSVTNGMPQAAQALVERIGSSGIGWLPIAIAILLTLGNLGGVGAWLAGSARLPFAAGVNDALPPAFAKLHPRWQTPYVSLILMGVLATIFIIASLANTTVKSAYLLLTQLTLILFFIPYVYIFVVYLKLRRQRTAGTLVLGLLGLVAVLLSIVLGFVPPADEANPFLYRCKVVAGVVVFTGLGLWLARRSRGTVTTV
ncbi:MAG TPA: APC family permease [Gemmatimonadales bacterium]|nr:APC family permease [Gemmatimonadales bacterium]